MARGPAKLDGVQALRGVAAALVVLDHSLLGISAWHPAPRLQHFAYFLGELGVAVFFVISGFIMLHTAGDEYEHRGAPGRFLRRRLERIAPLYWLATALAVVKEAAAGRSPSVINMASSALFLPMANGDRPVHTVGWTLNFEMFFYVLFACSLAFPRRIGLAAVIAGFGALAAAGLLVEDDATMFGFWSRPIILFFAAGVGLRWLRDRLTLVQAPSPIFASAAVLAAAAAIAWFVPSLTPLLLLLAAPAVALTVLTVNQSVPSPLKRLGDASYSLYLFHPFVVSILLLVWRRYLGEAMFPAYVAAAVVASVAGAVFVYARVERPIEDMFRRHRRRLKAAAAYSPGRTG